MLTKFFNQVSILMLLLGFGCLIGCGKANDGTVAASGTVTFEGQQVAAGMIVFVPVGDQKITGDSGKITNGKFDFGVKPGKKRIEIHATKAGKFDPVMNEAEQIEYIPEKYNLKSTLEKEVTATGKNEFEFHLTK